MTRAWPLDAAARCHLPGLAPPHGATYTSDRASAADIRRGLCCGAARHHQALPPLARDGVVFTWYKVRALGGGGAVYQSL